MIYGNGARPIIEADLCFFGLHLRDGSQGFDDNEAKSILAKLKPLNLYGWTQN